jgi:hypothetical protein
MQIEFHAYADDYTVHGDVALDTDRLAEFLEATHDIDVDNLDLRALDDGRQHHLPSGLIRREELCAVTATGPRGRIDRRLRTRAYPMRVEVGPYLVVGYFQALPTADPWTMVQRRQIVALSPARISFDVAGDRVEETHDALLLMRVKIDSLEEATDGDVALDQGLDDAIGVERDAEDMPVDVQWLGRGR